MFKNIIDTNKSQTLKINLTEAEGGEEGDKRGCQTFVHDHDHYKKFVHPL
jgi:hypothetical protein